MKNITTTLAAGLTLLAGATLATLSMPTAQAADHLDAPGVMKDGRLDINDIYAFQSPNNADNTVLIMTVNPVAGVMSPTTFNPNAKYQFNIDTNGDAVEEITFELRFGKVNKGNVQAMQLRRNGALIARGMTGETIDLRSKGGGSLIAGVFEDPFFFDLNGFNNGFQFTGDDFFAGLNVSAIVIELPSELVTGKSDAIGVWARTEIGGMQFDRMGRPAINTVLIPDGMKDAFNAGIPVNDFANFGDTVQATIESLNGGDTATAEALTAILLPDILTVDVSDPSGFLNGRQLADDVIDAELNLLTNGAVTTDGVDANNVAFLDEFPYLAPAN